MLLLWCRQSAGQVGNPVSALFFNAPSRHIIRRNFSALIARRLSRRWQQELSQHEQPPRPPPPAPPCQISQTPQNPITFPILGDDRAGSDHLLNLLISCGTGGLGGKDFYFPTPFLMKESAASPRCAMRRGSTRPELNNFGRKSRLLCPPHFSAEQKQ